MLVTLQIPQGEPIRVCKITSKYSGESAVYYSQSHKCTGKVNVLYNGQLSECKVLAYCGVSCFSLDIDIDQTDSHRSEPSSNAAIADDNKYRITITPCTETKKTYRSVLC